MKFRKKPVVIEAVRWFRHGDHEAVKPYLVDPMALVTCGACGQDMQIKRSMGGGVGISHATHGLIDTLEGKGLTVCPGDWIITGVKGEQYACKSDIFEMTYEAVTSPEYVGEPVAWRWRRKSGASRFWAYDDKRPTGLGIGDCEVQPLYISPRSET